MRKRLVSSFLAGTAMAVLLPAMFAQSANPSPAAASTPDISGVWLIDHYQANLFPKKDAPFTPWGEAQFKLSDTNVNDPNLSCLPHGLPRLMFVPIPFEIFQVPGRVLTFHEAGNQVRQIYLDRGHPKDLDPTYNGDSVGKWEGDTLVVDSIGFNDITWLDSVGLRHSEALHVVERIRRVDHDTLRDDFTVEDPKAFTRPWTASQIYKLKPGWSIREYTCDNNKYQFQPPK